MRAALIVNPVAGRGRAARQAPEIAARLRELAGDDVALHVTEEPGHAVQIAREVARASTPVLFVLGGDGTVHEALNGLRDPLGTETPPTILAPLDGGTGGDAVRLCTPGMRDEDVVQHALDGKARLVDVGRVRFQRLEWEGDRLGALPVRLFFNAANLGLAADITLRVADGRMPRAWAYPAAVIAAIAHGAPIPVSIAIDGGAIHEQAVWNVTVANGRTIGGGLPVAPHARPDDGVLDVATLGATSRVRAWCDLPRLRAGTHATLASVSMMRARTVRLATPEPAIVEADGEWIGETPCSIDVLPHAVRVVT